jgi:hypothetical protein
MPRRVRGPKAREVILTAEASDALTALEEGSDPRGQSIARRVRSLRPTLMANALHGEPVRRAVLQQRSAAPLARRHGLENCFCVDLPDGWRLLYTVVRHEQRVHIVIVEIVNHDTYDRWFPGRKS